MKKLLLIVMLFLINLALSGCQPGQSLASKLIPTPTATPSPEQKYCDNYEKSKSDQMKFLNANRTLGDFLETTYGPNNTSWAYLLSLMEAAGPISVRVMRENTPEELQSAIDVFSNYANTGVELQISLNREAVPTQVDYAQKRIISCVDQAVLFGNAYTLFLRDGVSISINPDISDCAQLDLYYEEITTFCNDF